MGIKQIGVIVLAGVLALGTAGCSRDHSKYKYNGKIGEDQVTFTEKNYLLTPNSNILNVIKQDGSVIEYRDELGDDLNLEFVKITNGQTTRYSRFDEFDLPILKEAQKQFDAYLQKIDEAKTQEKKERINQGLENLK